MDETVKAILKEVERLQIKHPSQPPAPVPADRVMSSFEMRLLYQRLKMTIPLALDPNSKDPHVLLNFILATPFTGETIGQRLDRMLAAGPYRADAWRDPRYDRSKEGPGSAI